MKKDFVTVGIVTFNSKKFISTAFAAVLAQDYPHFEIIILDNASTDGTAELLEKTVGNGHARSLRSSKNLGFAETHNRIYNSSQNEFYLCLNPDVILTPDFLSRLVEIMRSDETAAALGGKLLRCNFLADGTIKKTPNIDSVGLKLTGNFQVGERGAGETDRGQYDRAEKVFGISGAAILLRRTAFNSGKIFDPAFFAYKEDADLAFRLRWLGRKIFYEPRAVAWHVRAVGADRTQTDRPLLIRQLSLANQFLLTWKNYSPDFSWRVKIKIIGRTLALALYGILQPQLWPAFKMFFQKKCATVKNEKLVAAEEIEKWMK